MSLRLRLLIGLLALVAIGLGVTDAVTYVALQGGLVQRVDQELRDSVPSGERALSTGQAFGLSSGDYVALYQPGQSIQGYSVTYLPHQKPGPKPRLTQSMARSAGELPTYYTVSAGSGGGEFRVLTLALGGGQSFLLAFPLSDVDSTLAQLRLLELVVSGGVLLLLGVGAWWIVQLGLRPLARIRLTASAIAGGDLSRRVEPGAPRTEVGELATSLNEMLSQIERAFAARSASEARMRQFMSDASHELRTPLSSIRGYAELFRHGAEGHPDDLGKAMTRIESESARMTQLVDDLLLLARLDEGRPLERMTVDLSQLAVDAVADASVADRQHPIKVEAPAPMPVLGDEARLRQVIGNLLRNATLHTPAQTPIEVTVKQSGDAALLQVVDHGPGVAPEIAARIFERFVRADPSRGREQGGSGLGLAIVAAIVAAHQGTLRLEQTPGGGATFSVRIPIELQNPSPPDRAASD
ncbi:MAG TPA: HAMP domain-containing sensor histidine kinase [Candidatus Micrarchaeaceae archaeon]|nr:HAMP domain-containing sensor histidine kinase [Candidatus Micrarchaeaceae archaeon]